MAHQATTDPALVAELERSRRMLAEAQALARVGSWEWDVPANKVTWSDELYRIYGYAPGAFEPTYETFLAHVHADDRDAVDARNRAAFADHQPFDDTKRILKADGSEILMRTQGEVVTGPDGAVLRMLGVCEDVTDRLRAQAATALLASIVESSNDAIYTIAAQTGQITSWNPAAERLFGYTEREAIGLDARRLVPDSHADEDERLLARALADRPIESWETLRTRRDASRLAVSVAMSPLRDIHGRISGVSVIARDVSERRRFEQQLRYLSDHDALTGMPNRARFEEELERAVDYATRYDTGGALFLIDLDGFKRVNDALGHAAGDELIRSVAQTLRARLRSTDVLARLGGDELAVLVPIATPEQAEAAARGVVEAVRDHVARIGGQDVRVTTSLGGVHLEDVENAADALARADLALYAAKDAGRDRHAIFGPELEAPAGGAWEDRIEHALRHGGLELFVQPLLDLHTGEVGRYEALLRMHHQDEVILPGAFLPTAERSGQIHAIDRWVVTEAIALLARLPDLELEVNLSARSLDDEALIDHVASELARSRVDPTRLVLEITETATIANMQDARRLADALAELGCRFAIDDFGTGFGSFSYLKHLPAAFLKIDGEFIQSPRSRTDELVIEAIVGMAQGLGKQTIAEFVSDEDTVAMLRATGVDYAQGFHVGRPFPAARLGA